MQPYSSSIDTVGGSALRNASVAVKLDGALATIYALDGTPQDNPMTTDSTGSFSFRAANGEYTLEITRVGIVPRTETVLLYDPADDESSTANLAAEGGAALVGVIQTGAGAVARTVQDKLRDEVSVHDFGTVGAGGDDTAKLQAAVNAAAGGIMRVRSGTTLQVTSTVTVPADTWLDLRGAIINASASHFTLFDFADGGGIIGGKLVGAGGSITDEGGIAVACLGVSDGIGAPTYVKHPTLMGVWITEWGFMGVQAKYARDGIIDGSCRIDNCGYAGYGGYSVTNVHILPGARIEGIVPGSGGNAYGAFFSRVGSASLVVEPRSSDCSVVGAIIDNVPLWEGLDTHGGERIRFARNRITNCKIPIAIGPSNGGASSMYAPHRCSAVENDIDGGTAGAAVTLTGARAAGAVVEYAEDNVVAKNNIRNGGVAGNDIQGAIILHTTKRSRVVDNSLKNPAMFGICLYVDNVNFNIGGNAIVDPFDSTKVNPACIAVRDKNNIGVIGPNTFGRVDTSLGTYVAVYAMYFTPSVTGNDITVAKQHFYGFTGNVINLPSDQTKINCAGMASAAGSASIAIVSGDGTDSVAVTFGKELPMPIKTVALVVTSSLTVGGKAPLLTIGNKSTTGFTIYARPYDLTSFTASGTLSIDWSAST